MFLFKPDMIGIWIRTVFYSFKFSFLKILRACFLYQGIVLGLQTKKPVVKKKSYFHRTCST